MNKDLTFIGKQSIGVKQEDLEVYYPDDAVRTTGQIDFKAYQDYIDKLESIKLNYGKQNNFDGRD